MNDSGKDGLLMTSQEFYCGRKFCELNEPPSTSFEEAPSQRSSTVAYTERKSVEYFRLPFSSRLLRLGGSPKMPLFTALPSTNIGAAVPWSVPRLPFSSTRRPNSDQVMTTTLSALPWCARSV